MDREELRALQTAGRALETLLGLTERFYIVFQTLSHTPQLTATVGSR